MPVYEYHCAQCGPFTELRGIDRCSAPADCPACGQAAPKVFSAVNLRSMRGANRLAWERNERSANAPHVCGAGCSHGRPQPKTKTRPDGKPAIQYSRKQNSRPWMLGH